MSTFKRLTSTVGDIAAVAKVMTKDRIRGEKITTLTDIPSSVDAITADWLTAALQGRIPGVQVRAVRPESLSDGTTSRSLVHVEYVNGSGSEPATLFVKSTASLTSRLHIGRTGGAEGEARYYRLIEPGSGVLTPTGYYGATDRVSGKSVILLEDIARTRGATFGNPTTVTINKSQAESLVQTLATLHGSLLESERFKTDLRWVSTSLRVQQGLNDLVSFQRRTVVGFNRGADLIPSSLHPHRDDLHALLMYSLSLDKESPIGIVHTDVHAGNWFTTADDEMGLFDWQAVAKGQGPRDLVYALSSNLTVEDRRAWERGLIELYADHLSKAAGRQVYSVEQVWEAYRRQSIHALCFWLNTLGAGLLQPAMQPRPISSINLERIGQAVEDLDTISALRRGPRGI
jgi:thiamine kinase-like enzyme